MMLKRELLRLGLCAASGLIIGLLYAGPKAMVHFALYAIGLFYGIRFVLPALLGALKTFGNAGIMSIVFKNPIGILIFIFLCILVVGLIITVAWIAGIIIAVMRLWQAFQEDRAMGTPFRPHFPSSGRSRPRAGAGARRQDSWNEDDWDSGSVGASGSSGGSSWDSDDWNSDDWND